MDTHKLTGRLKVLGCASALALFLAWGLSQRPMEWLREGILLVLDISW
jgi:hypothetical protein